jgi:hypothetical protein
MLIVKPFDPDTDYPHLASIKSAIFTAINRKAPAFRHGDVEVSSRSDAYECEALEKNHLASLH